MPTSSAYGNAYVAVNAVGGSGVAANAIDDGDDDDEQLTWKDAEAGEDVVDYEGYTWHGGAGIRNTLPYYDDVDIINNTTNERYRAKEWHHGSFTNPLEMGLSDGGVWAFSGVGGGGGAAVGMSGSAGVGKVLVPLDPSDRRYQWPLPYPGWGTPAHCGNMDTGGYGAIGDNGAPADSRPGCGGNGGHGGGGGGGAGVTTYYNRTYNEVIFYGMGVFDMTGGVGGKGGAGGQGSAGQHGCVIIYY